MKDLLKVLSVEILVLENRLKSKKETLKNILTDWSLFNSNYVIGDIISFERHSYARGGVHDARGLVYDIDGRMDKEGIPYITLRYFLLTKRGTVAQKETRNVVREDLVSRLGHFDGPLEHRENTTFVRFEQKVMWGETVVI